MDKDLAILAECALAGVEEYFNCTLVHEKARTPRTKHHAHVDMLEVQCRLRSIGGKVVRLKRKQEADHAS